MGRKPCCLKEGMNRGAWTASEDKVLVDYINAHGEGKWRNIPNQSGLKRCGKSCRLRWLNYLRPDIKRGNITSDEDDLIIRLHKLLGNRWSLIAGRLPGRTDNEIKNYWNTNLSKRASDKLQQSRNSISGIIHAKPVRFIERIPQLENNIIRDHSDGTQNLKHADSVLERKEFAQVMTSEFNLEDTSFSEFFGDDFDQCEMSTMLEGDDTSVNWCKTELPTFLGEAFLSSEKWSGDLDCGQVNTNLDFESFGLLETEVGWI